MKKKLTTVLLATLLTTTVSLFADGMPIKDGRFQGDVTVLTLDKSQIKSIETKDRLVLRVDQKKVLQKDTGKWITTFLAYETHKGENDCTCFAENLALRFSETQVEIPHQYLVAAKTPE